MDPHNYQVLIEKKGHLTPPRPFHYEDIPFSVMEKASKVGVVMTHIRKSQAQLYLSLHDPNGFRGNRMNLSDNGTVVTELWVAPDEASLGAIPGNLPLGLWRVQMDCDQLAEETDYQIVVYAEYNQSKEPANVDYSKFPIINQQAGWYKGELHAHSTESDGKHSYDEMVTAALNAGLNFFSLTDHFTCSQWYKLSHLEQSKIALLHSLEITSHHGHANMHGLKQWVDVFVDRPGWDMEQAAESSHAQGGLFCINHAFSSECSWRAYNFDWSKADLIEIYHNLEGPNNHYQLGLWDRILMEGHRIIGVAGTDSHNLNISIQRLGYLVTWVYAKELSEEGIIEGLRKGRVYVSRGGEMRFWAENIGGNHAEMGEELLCEHSKVLFTVQVKTQNELRMYVLKNGLYFKRIMVPVSDSWQTITFTDQPDSVSYYRLEFHKIFIDQDFPGIEWRDFSTTDMLSNPIWLT